MVQCVKKRTEYYIQVGLYFGYPICCIEAFNQFLCVDQIRTLTQVIASNSTGFIPCDNHAKQIESKKATLESLLINKVSKSVFPIDNSEEDNQYINSLKS